AVLFVHALVAFRHEVDRRYHPAAHAHLLGFTGKHVSLPICRLLTKHINKAVMVARLRLMFFVSVSPLNRTLATSWNFVSPVSSSLNCEAMWVVSLISLHRDPDCTSAPLTHAPAIDCCFGYFMFVKTLGYF